MEELIRTTDLLTIAYAEALLKEAGIGYFIADHATADIIGLSGSIPRRVLVVDDDLPRARRLITDAGLGHELRPERTR